MTVEGNRLIAEAIGKTILSAPSGNFGEEHEW
jgi:hypothetical protein